MTFGEKVTPSPATVTVPARRLGRHLAGFAVDNANTIASPASFTGGGQIVLTNAAVPSDVHNIQFAFTKAARATVTFDRAYPDALWVNESHTNLVGGARLDDNTSEVLMIPGTWDMLIYTREFDATGAITGVDFIGREAVALTKDTTIALTAADIPHTITLGGRRETGADSTGNGYASGGRILLGTGGSHRCLSVQQRHAMHVSDLTTAKTLLLYEAMLDTADEQLLHDSAPAARRRERGREPDHRRFRAARRHGATGHSGGIARRPAADSGRDQPERRRRFVDQPSSTRRSSTRASSSLPTSIRTTPTASRFNAITDASDAVHDAAAARGERQAGEPRPCGLLPWTYSGTSYEFGLGPRFPSWFLTPATGTQRLNWATDIIGPLGEVRIGDRAGTTNTLFDANGAMLSAAGSASTVDLARRRPTASRR